MGLDTTAVHAMWFVALLVGGGALTNVGLREWEETREVHATVTERERAAWDAEVDVVAAVASPGIQQVRVQLYNAGAVALDPDEASVFFQGVPKTVLSVETGGLSGSRVWAPGTHANVTVDSKWAPKRLLVADEYGHTFVWNNPEPPYLAEIVVAPDPVDVEATRTEAFTAEGFDQYGDAYAINPTWATTVSGASVNPSSGLFTAGTTIACGTVTATDDGVTGTADVCVVPLEVRVESIKMYKGSTEQYTFRRNENPTTKVTIVAVSDGTAVASVNVGFAWKDLTPEPDVTMDTATDATDATGVADDLYNIPNSANRGPWTVEVTGVTASWITYRSDLNAETVQAFTVS